MIKSATVQEEFASAYKAEDTEIRLRRYRVACVLSLIGTGSGVTLDYIVNPELLWPLFIVRFSAVLVILLLFGISQTPFTRSRIVLFNFLWAMTVNASICAMVYVTGGAVSPYYAGLNLVILAAGVLLPWTLFETLTVSLATLSMYVITCVLWGWASGQAIAWSLLFSNCFFIFLTGLISTTSSHFTTQARIRDFNLRNELDARNKELEDLDRLKSQFFANVSHELRTPLTLILAPIQDLLQMPEALSNAASKHLRTARDNALRLLKLVNDLLEVIKLEEGKTRLEMRKVDLNAFLGSMVDSMTPLAEPRGIELKKELPAEPLNVQADSYALERIVLNLLSNAIKFTPEGGTITVRTRRQGDMALLEIEDTGIGISEQDLPKIFERFQQADGSSTRKYQGSGLGLALVRDLSEKMGGEATATSESGKGTTMTIKLQLIGEEAGVDEGADADLERKEFLEKIHQAAEHRAALPINSPFEKQEARFSEGEGPLLMIVEDEPDMRQYLVSFLDTEYRISQVRDGRQALQLARETQPDLMLLDLMLPEIDGHEVCRLLKEDPETRKIKIVLLTARVDEEAKLVALKNGADDFLTKPFSRTEVETRLRNLYDTARLESDLSDRNTELESALTQLKEAQSNLVRSEKLNALGGLSAGLLHEVNNPLNYVISAIQLARMESAVQENGNLQEYFDDIDEGVGRIRNIVSDLHTFAHPSEVEKQKAFSLSRAIESALRFTANECKGIRIEKEVAEDDIIIGSEGHIVQVLINLLTNASSAIRQIDSGREGKIGIKASRIDEQLRVSVTDNGAGMNFETKERAFEPFFTTKDVGKGMGLGLSICHTIIKSHGGEIQIQSVEKVGSEFVFSLPLVQKKMLDVQELNTV